MTVLNLENKDSLAWQEFVASHSDSNLCQDLRWKQVLSDTFGHQADYLIYTDKNDSTKILGVLPLVFVKSRLFGKGLISIPYLNAGGILATSLAADQALLEAATQNLTALKGDYLELRLQHSLSAEKQEITSDSSQTKLIERQHKVTFLLDLPTDPDTLLKSFSSKLRSQINRPIKAGAEFICIKGSEVTDQNLADFYKIFSEHSRDLGTPVYPLALFKNTFRAFQDDAMLAFVSLNNQLTSAGIVLKHKSKAEIIWAASLRKFHSDSVNMLLYWGFLKELCLQGLTQFDFGRTSYNTGGYKFKKQWDGNELPLYWYYYGKSNYIPDINPRDQKFSLLVKTWQQLPLYIAKRIGPVLTKHLP